MKNAIKALLQRALGYRRYLRLFAWFKVKTLRHDRREDDFFAFLALLPEDGVVLDVGANLGFLTAHLAAHLRRGQVIAFEPMPDNVHALRDVVRRFALKNVAIESCALADRDGEVEMRLPVEGHARQQGLSHLVRRGTESRDEGIRFVVPVKRLDGFTFLFAPGVNVTGLKIDVEGVEHLVLAGATRLVETHRPLIYLELGEDENTNACLALFRQWDYELTVNVRGMPEPYDRTAHAGRINFLARPLRQPVRGR